MSKFFNSRKTHFDFSFCARYNQLLRKAWNYPNFMEKNYGYKS
jgi:hypothetical protein